MPKASTFALRLATQMIDSDTFPMLTNAGENVRVTVSEARSLVGPGWSDTINAYNEVGASDEIKIQAAISRAISTGKTIVFIPTSMLPYDATLVTFNDAIRMVREGGDFSVYDVAAYGAAGDDSTDDTIAIQAALDAIPVGGGEVAFPPTTSLSYRIDHIVIKESGTQLIGVGGQVRLKFNGTAASAQSVLIVDKATYNGGNNYRDITIQGFIIDGNGLALRGLDLYGFTRRCCVRNVSVNNCVNPLRLVHGFYSSWKDVEFFNTPFFVPSGMNAGTYAANLYGAYLDVCHAASFMNATFDNIGGDSSDQYIAVLRIGNSNAISLQTVTFESMALSVHENLIILQLTGQTTLKASTLYIEEVFAANTVIDMVDNTALDMDLLWLNNVVAPYLISSANEKAPIRLGVLDAENVDFSIRLFHLTAGSAFSNLSLDRVSLGAGTQTSTYFDANTTVGSKKGISCAPILLDNHKAAGATGYLTNDYGMGLGATYVEINSGTAIINGQSVGFAKSSGLKQRLYPDLSVADTWNIKISPAGTPYIERQSALRAESTYAPTIGTFTTPGGAGAPAGLTAVLFNINRIAGAQIDHPKSVNTVISRSLRAWAACPTATATSLATLTLSSTGGEDDSLTAVIEFTATIGAGANHSTWRGFATYAFTQDASPNRVAACSAVPWGDAKALDANVATWTIVPTITIASNVATCKITSTPATGETVALEYSVFIQGGGRATSTGALASGVTVGE